MSNPFVLIAGFCFGLCIGSFLNVCICRLPEGKSIITPPSQCPRCNTAIRFFDNIPVLSYLWLAGKCRYCKTPISPRYPLVEFLAGGFAVCSLIKYGMTFSALIFFIFIAALIVITFIDLDHQIIPDIVTLPGIPIFFAAAAWMPDIAYTDALIGIAAGGGSLYAVALGYSLLTGTEGMGGGDIKLLAMIGALLGWQGVILTIFAASVSGTLVGGTLMLASGKNLKFAVPFGPFLAFGAIIYVFFGQSLIQWYLYGANPF